MYQDSCQKTQRGNFHASPLVACELCSGKTKRKAKNHEVAKGHRQASQLRPFQVSKQARCHGASVGLESDEGGRQALYGGEQVARAVQRTNAGEGRETGVELADVAVFEAQRPEGGGHLSARPHSARAVPLYLLKCAHFARGRCCRSFGVAGLGSARNPNSTGHTANN